MTNPTCPKCNSPMDEGFIVDDTYGGHVQSQWAEKQATTVHLDRLKLAKDAKHPVTTFRCEKCGYLESYASVE